MIFYKFEWRSVVKFSMIGCIIMTVSYFELVMDYWINVIVFLSDFNILLNYDFIIFFLYKLIV